MNIINVVQQSQYGDTNVSICLNDRKGLPELLSNIPVLPKFVGRRKELKALKTLVNRTQCIQINGIGGIGKTALAINFLKKSIDSKDFDYFIYIELRGGIMESFVSNTVLVDTLGLTERIAALKKDMFSDRETNSLDTSILSSHNDYSIYLSEALNLIAARLQEIKGKGLLIVDNSEEIELLQPVLSRLFITNWTIIFTTRSVIQGWDSVNLDCMSNFDARQLFKQHYWTDIKSSKQVTGEIVKLLGYHPFAICFVSKNASYVGWQLKKTLELLRAAGIKLEIPDISVVDKHAQRKDSLITLLLKLFPFESLTDKALIFVQLFGLNGTEGLTASELYTILRQVFSNLFLEDVETHLQVLQKRGWLNINSVEKGRYYVHKLMADAVLEYQPPSGELFDNLSLSVGIRLSLINSHYDEILPTNAVGMFEMLSHYPLVGKLQLNDSLWKYYSHIGLHEKALKCGLRQLDCKADKEFEKSYPIALSKVGLSYLYLEEPAKAFLYIHKYHDIRMREYYALQTDVKRIDNYAIALEHLSRTYRLLGMPEQSFLPAKKSVHLMLQLDDMQSSPKSAYGLGISYYQLAQWIGRQQDFQSYFDCLNQSFDAFKMCYKRDNGFGSQLLFALATVSKDLASAQFYEGTRNGLIQFRIENGIELFELAIGYFYQLTDDDPLCYNYHLEFLKCVSGYRDLVNSGTIAFGPNSNIDNFFKVVERSIISYEIVSRFKGLDYGTYKLSYQKDFLEFFLSMDVCPKTAHTNLLEKVQKQLIQITTAHES